MTKASGNEGLRFFLWKFRAKHVAFVRLYESMPIWRVMGNKPMLKRNLDDLLLDVFSVRAIFLPRQEGGFLNLGCAEHVNAL